MRRSLALCIGVLAIATVSVCSIGRSEAPAADAGAALTDRVWLSEIMRYLYRWHLDERDVDPVVTSNEVVFWVREVHPALDEGDRSRFGEVVLPQFGITVRVKQADYSIPELDAVVKNDTFRIVSVVRGDVGEPRPENAVEVKFVYTELRDELFRTRGQAGFPEGELLERLRGAVRARIAKEGIAERAGAAPAQLVYLAPLSPVANETWVFWETGRMLIRFASDIDLTNPSVWDHEELAVEMIDLDRNVVVALDEVSGSNAFITRDQAGRALYNCVVLGRRMELTPQPPKE